MRVSYRDEREGLAARVRELEDVVRRMTAANDRRNQGALDALGQLEELDAHLGRARAANADGGFADSVESCVGSIRAVLEALFVSFDPLLHPSCPACGSVPERWEYGREFRAGPLRKRLVCSNCATTYL